MDGKSTYVRISHSVDNNISAKKPRQTVKHLSIDKVFYIETQFP